MFVKTENAVKLSLTRQVLPVTGGYIPGSSPISARSRLVNKCRESVSYGSSGFLTTWRFRRKASLIKHQQRSHPPKTAISPSSRDAVSGDSNPGQVAIFISNEQCPSNQQETLTHESHAPQMLYVAQASVQDQNRIVTQPIMATTSVETQRAQDYCLSLAQQRQYVHVYQGHLPLGFEQPYRSPSIAKCPSLMVTRTPSGYNPAAHIVNQPVGTNAIHPWVRTGEPVTSMTETASGQIRNVCELSDPFSLGDLPFEM
ncbi:hypothetical protein ABHI18_012662 [Aspergillus niger]